MERRVACRPRLRSPECADPISSQPPCWDSLSAPAMVALAGTPRTGPELFAAYGRWLGRGLTLYRDLWDSKPRDSSWLYALGRARRGVQHAPRVLDAARRRGRGRVDVRPATRGASHTAGIAWRAPRALGGRVAGGDSLERAAHSAVRSSRHRPKSCWRRWCSQQCSPGAATAPAPVSSPGCLARGRDSLEGRGGGFAAARLAVRKLQRRNATCGAPPRFWPA
jgi:hypothetical protein